MNQEYQLHLQGLPKLIYDYTKVISMRFMRSNDLEERITLSFAMSLLSMAYCTEDKILASKLYTKAKTLVRQISSKKVRFINEVS